MFSGQPHEIHAATDTLPGIVLHVAEGHENNKNNTNNKTSVNIPHTRFPDKWNNILQCKLYSYNNL